MDTPAKRRKLVAAALANPSPSDLPAARIPPTNGSFAPSASSSSRTKSPAKRLTHDDFYGEQNPFGQRSRVVGGERYPVRGNQGGGGGGDGGESYIPPESPTGDREQERRGRGRKDVADREQAPSKSASQKQKQPSKKARAEASAADIDTTATSQPRERTKVPPRSRQSAIAAEASPPASQQSQQSQQQRKAKRDKINSPAGTPTKRKKQKTRKSSFAADAARTPMEKELEALKEVLLAERDLMQNEIAALDEEILVQKTQGSLEFGPDMIPPKATDGVVEGLNSLIYNLLRINDKSLEPVVRQYQLSQKESENKEIIPSARPLHASSTIFHLGALSPLKFTDCSTTTTTITSNESLQDSRRTLRKQSFKGYSHEKLLYFDVLLVVDPYTSPPTVESIDLSISDWAKPELYGFLNACAPEKNICNMLYSLGSYCDIAKSRAMTWARVENERPELFQGRNLQKRKAVQDPSKEFGGLPRVQILSYLPQQRIRLCPAADPDSADKELVINWRIEVDVSGEARSRISTDVRTPEAWVDENSIDTIRNIPSTFKALLKEKGVDNAIFSLVEILFGAGEK